MATYTVVLLDSDGYETASDELYTISDAKKRARYLLSDAYAVAVESSHADLKTAKAEVRNPQGVCLWDAFRSNDR